MTTETATVVRISLGTDDDRRPFCECAEISDEGSLGETIVRVEGVPGTSMPNRQEEHLAAGRAYLLQFQVSTEFVIVYEDRDGLVHAVRWGGYWAWPTEDFYASVFTTERNELKGWQSSSFAKGLVACWPVRRITDLRTGEPHEGEIFLGDVSHAPQRSKEAAQ